MPIETVLNKCREVMRLKHLSYRTEQTYLPVIRRFIESTGGRTHPKDIGAAEIRAFLSHLAVEQNVPASIQNVAFSALLFLYRDVLRIELPAIEQGERAQRAARLPEVSHARGGAERHRTNGGHATADGEPPLPDRPYGSHKGGPVRIDVVGTEDGRDRTPDEPDCLCVLVMGRLGEFRPHGMARRAGVAESTSQRLSARAGVG